MCQYFEFQNNIDIDAYKIFCGWWRKYEVKSECSKGQGSGIVPS